MIGLAPEQEICAKIKTVAERIAEESQKQHPGETDVFGWKTFIVGKISLRTGLSVADLELSYPGFSKILKGPLGVSDEDSLIAYGFWRDHAQPLTAIQFFFISPDKEQKTITIQAEPVVLRKLKTTSSPEVVEEIESVPLLSQNIAEVVQLNEDIIKSGNFDALFAIREKQASEG